MMKKKAYLALLIALALLLSGCTLKSVDPVADAAQVILNVNGEKVTKAQMTTLINNYTNNLLNTDMNALYYYYYYGRLPYSNTELLDQTITAVTRSMVQEQEVVKQGFDKLTDEELSQVQADAEARFEETIQEEITEHFADSELTGDELHAAAVAHAAEEGVTLDSFLDSLKKQKTVDKLRESVVKDVSVTDEEVKADFDAKVASQKETYDASPAAYIEALNNNEEIFYVPAGVRYVKHILIQYPEEASTAITDAKSKVTEAQNALDSANTAVTDAGEQVTDELKQAVTDAEKALADAQAALDEAVNAANAQIKDKADEAYAKAVEEGADFDALVAEYGEDPGMKSEPYLSEGYPVAEGASYDEAFLAASLALEKVGDVTEPVVSSFGMHIIRFESEAAAGEAVFEDHAEDIRDELLTARKDEVYNAALQGWIDASDVKSFPAKMGF